MPCSMMSFCCLMTSYCSGRSVWEAGRLEDTLKSRELILSRRPASCSGSLSAPPSVLGWFSWPAKPKINGHNNLEHASQAYPPDPLIICFSCQHTLADRKSPQRAKMHSCPQCLTPAACICCISTWYCLYSTCFWEVALFFGGVLPSQKYNPLDAAQNCRDVTAYTYIYSYHC